MSQNLPLADRLSCLLDKELTGGGEAQPDVPHAIWQGNKSDLGKQVS